MALYVLTLETDLSNNNPRREGDERKTRTGKSEDSDANHRRIVGVRAKGS